MTIDTGIIAVSSLHYPFYKLVIMLKSAIIPAYTAYSSNQQPRRERRGMLFS